MTVTKGVQHRLITLLLPEKPPPLFVGVIVAVVVVAVETVGLALLHAADPQRPPIAVIYILGVVALTAVWGARLGIGVALASTLVFNFIYISPLGLHLSTSQDLQRAVTFGLVALASGGLADVARTRAAEARQRAAEGDFASEFARRVLAEDELASGLRAGSRCLAAWLGLSPVAIEIGAAPGEAKIAGATVLELAGKGRGRVRLVVPDTTPPETLERLRDRLGPVLDEIVHIAVDRHELIGTLRASQQATQALLAEQAALRRVATLVATGSPPREVFAAVTAELHRLFQGFHTALMRYEPDRTVTAVSERDTGGRLMPDHPSLPITGENIAGMILRTRRTAQIDYDTATGPIAERLRARGVRRGLGVPIVVDGELWGIMLVLSVRPEPVPADAEQRLGDFTELVAAAIASTENRARLIASRGRLVAAADDARRRIERDLHDGPQQRIVALALRLRMAQDSVLDDPAAAGRLLSETVRNLTEIHECMTDLARGIHPALLTQGGICPMLRTLVRRSTVPVDLRLQVDRRLPERVEVAVYYVVSEALTNIAKHAHASTASVTVGADERRVWLSVRDDGVGGARLDGGTGLVGLRDRVEALGGRLSVVSPPAHGTTLTAEIALAEPDPCAAVAPFPMVRAG
ncbi:DUF4118 domain-containing protein [Dactylosporangium aurantiacum]|uniref:histidine kinase n=1 Tax=Dactylosporangium aurantiacum TaxID=35754 RepID=A0A9Q9MKD6_9ACTN|nr:DUF4118 domain-containing protein [Dactylosporangium aurantiacum]MDG6101393.1 DUF4118 domain-containing protein [Dactylosporangium aurantiacum]UWZ52752.1 DUF4118 domain-containing protein [Dactylosporangium aurantiacum]